MRSPKDLASALKALLCLAFALGAGCKACDSVDPIGETAGGTADPVPPVTTVPAEADGTGEKTPTGGEEPCPGYNDVCIFDSPDQTRSTFKCEGTARIRLDADPYGEDYDDMYPRDYNFPFTVTSYAQAQVIACCSDEYLQGCDALGLRPPHESYCMLDCAQQSCFRVVYELDATIKDLEAGGKTPALVLNQFVAVRNYLAAEKNIAACQTTLFQRAECAVMAQESGVPFAKFCEAPNILRGRYRVPNSDDWSLIKDLYGDLECEITDYSHPDVGILPCNGIQGNNVAPFGAQPFAPFASIEPFKVIEADDGP